MSGLPYQGGFNSYMFDVTQYGTSLPSSQSALSGLSGLAGSIPYIGPLIGAGMNMLGTWMQNRTQEEFYNRYMSPRARMAQMKAAGINPNAAAQGIAGAAAPQITAASPSSAFSALGEQLGNSANTALTANVLRTESEKNQSEADLNKSLNVEKTITNSYLDKQQQVALDKLVSEGKIAKSTANMLSVDEYYKPAVAEANYQQLCMNLGKTFNEIENLIANTEKAYADAYASMMAGNLSEAQIHKVFSDIGLNNAMIRKIGYEVDVLAAQELLVGQEMKESEARTIAQNIQNKFQQDYYDIWDNTGFNWNSDTEKSVVGAFANMQTDEAERMLSGMSSYVTRMGDARSKSKDFMYENIVNIYGHLTHSLTGLGAAGINASSYRYGANKLYEGNVYSADKHYQGMQEFGKNSPTFRRKVFDDKP